MVSKLAAHNFDANVFTERVRAELVRRGVNVDPDDQTTIARRFAARAHELSGREPLENLCAHPFWVHLEGVHGPQQQHVVKGCQVCALLYVMWIPYRLRNTPRDRRLVELASASRTALPLLRTIRGILSRSPAADGDVQLLSYIEDSLTRYSTAHHQCVDPDLRQAMRKGRRSHDLLRVIERVLHEAGFKDGEVASLVHGSRAPDALRGIRDRRRKRDAAKVL